MYKYTKNILVFCLMLFLPTVFVFAYVPERIVQESLLDITNVKNPEEEHFFYGDLDSFPNTFQITSEESFNLYVEIRVPDIEGVVKNISGIIIKEKNTGGVEEVSRLSASDATWDPIYEYFDGNSYLLGPSFESRVQAGVYRIEVNTPDNLEKYVLVIGRADSTEKIGFFEKISRIADTKVFFGKSQVMIIESPLVYKSLIVLIFTLIIIFVIVRKLKRRAL